MTRHRLKATPETTRFGSLSAAFPPVLTIASGDTVEIECVSGGPEMMPVAGSGFIVPDALRAIHEAMPVRVGPHIVTGPVAIAGAEPGDTLEVHVDDIAFGADWGFCVVKPLLGTLPVDFPEFDLTHIPIDAAGRVCTLPWGARLPLAPFFGVMGVAPPPAYGLLSTKEPREFGGNLDNKELGIGSTLYLPVLIPGANFSVGDGHGVQGDGEVCVNALEMCLNGTFTFTLHKRNASREPLRYPRAETATQFISFGMHADLDQAMEKALREMIAFICERTGWTPMQAYKTCSLGVDFRVTQTVNGEKGIHGMLRKGLIFD
jgi:acetamidase/formamidase